MYDAIRALFSPLLSFPLSFFYDLTGSYVVAIFLLTLLIKILLLPVSIKQQKNSAKQTRLNAKVNRIRQKYQNNQQKAQEEIQALYQREGFGAANMGCMPMMIQMLVMIGLYGVMYTPLSSVLRFSSEKVAAIKDVMASVISTDAKTNEGRMYEINILKNYDDFTDELSQVLSAKDFSDLAELSEKFTFMGLDLSVTPDKSTMNAYWLIPILSFFTAMLSSVYLYFKQRKQNPEMAKNPTMGCMTFMSPVTSLIFTFMFPTGVGVYWIISNVISFVQQVLLSALYSPKKVIAQQMVDETVVRRSKEKTTKLRVENEKK